MKLSNDEVREIALEARLTLDDAELEKAARYINNFLSMLDRFKELDLKEVEPFCFAEKTECPLREDVLTPFGDVKAILAEGPHRVGDYFKVPRIMEE